jgi:hypothetical protein
MRFNHGCGQATTEGNGMPDVRLVHVVAVAPRGSFTAAAEAVGVTQSAITKSASGP